MDNNSFCVFRGGGWGFDIVYARVVIRLKNDPGVRGDGLGVRLVRNVTPLQQLAEANNE